MAGVMPSRPTRSLLVWLVSGATALAFAAAAPAASAQETEASPPPAEEAPPPEVTPPPARMRRRPASDRARGFFEARGGLGTYADHAGGFGPKFGLAGGLAWGWVDLGIAANYASLPHDGISEHTTIFGVGPEIATRTWLGGPATLRLAVDPQYRQMSFAGASTGTIGADVLAQFLFTMTEGTVPEWRVGVGVHGGRFWEMGAGKAAFWTAGLDVVVRTWW
jgi:hypothetical protein